MTYRFRPLPELYWGVVVAASLVLLQALLTLEPEQVTDWRVWAVALGGGVVRAAAGAALDYLRRSAAEAPAAVTDPAVDVDLVSALADELERRREARVQARLQAVQGDN